MTDGFYMMLHRILTESCAIQKLSENRSSLLGGYVVVVLTSGML